MTHSHNDIHAATYEDIHAAELAGKESIIGRVMYHQGKVVVTLAFKGVGGRMEFHDKWSKNAFRDLRATYMVDNEPSKLHHFDLFTYSDILGGKSVNLEELERRVKTLRKVERQLNKHLDKHGTPRTHQDYLAAIQAATGIKHWTLSYSNVRDRPCEDIAEAAEYLSNAIATDYQHVA